VRRLRGILLGVSRLPQSSLPEVSCRIIVSQRLRSEAWQKIRGQFDADRWQHLIRARGYRLIGETEQSETELAAAVATAGDDLGVVRSESAILRIEVEPDPLTESLASKKRLVHARFARSTAEPELAMAEVNQILADHPEHRPPGPKRQASPVPRLRTAASRSGVDSWPDSSNECGRRCNAKAVASDAPTGCPGEVPGR
jgi:hypothetical protein